jgi:hypothetical protein
MYQRSKIWSSLAKISLVEVDEIVFGEGTWVTVRRRYSTALGGSGSARLLNQSHCVFPEQIGR